MKKTWKKPTVLVAWGAVVAAFLSLYMTWGQQDGITASFMALIKEDPEFFQGVLALTVVGLLWSALFFLLNHPKLTLLGDLVSAFCGFAMSFSLVDIGVDLGFGAILFFLAIIVLIVMAFATKKIRQPKNQSAAQ